MAFLGMIAVTLASSILGNAIFGKGKKKKSLRLLMGIKKRKGYKRMRHHSKPVKLHGGKKTHRRHHLKKHRSSR